LLAAPLLAAAALAVAVSSKGPILFRQRRIGQHGRPFDLLKLRSMTINNDSDTTWNVALDVRVTRVGRILRRTSLDELPQLINVLKGDMSLVGPRPERPFYVLQFEETIPRYRDRHRAPVGLTGWAQIHGLRGDSSIDDRVRFDNNYIEHWSIWRDLSILARTLSAMLRGE
jgi:lipopolysaccharide/colanic/teichoic acid biosynthesis glycosyltransferase